ncbi:MAG: iron-sulfur cluster assembly accessory protein [Burkholderiaceae bacterium]|nr:iron-sulfur cluster assembly accessory protein [Burkholderiaceae bacterium]
MLPNVTITPAAAKFIKRIVRFSGLAAGAGLRLAVSPGGCSGYSSEFSAEAAPAAGEQLLEVGGVRLFLGAESRLMLQGITIDFTETATQSGLSFIDPNKEACACSSAETAPKVGVTKIEISAIGRGRPAAPILAS